MALVSIRTPATTANLGPGFDCVGVALELYNELEASWQTITPFSGSELELAAWLQANSKIKITGEGADELLDSGIGLFFQALARLLTPAASCPVNLTLSFNNDIPLARGLGSSAACIVSALCLGREILATVGQKVELALLAAEATNLEGHPDNVLPALFGGACLNIVRSKALPLTLPLQIPSQLSFVFAVPELRIRTTEARRVLPQSVSLSEAVHNSALLGGLVLALMEEDLTHLAELIQSPLHIPYRSQLIPGYSDVEKAAYQLGAVAFTISGAGPSVLALTVNNSKEIGAAMVEAFKKAGVSARYFVSKVDNNGAMVEKGRLKA